MPLASQVVRLGFYMGYAVPGQSPLDLVAAAREAESLGYSSAWCAEAWGTDAITPLAWLGAQTSTIKLGSGIMQLPGRSPALAAMTAATLDLLSGGRFILGLGTSGPQVVEGWHGDPWGKPLGKTREYVEIVRTVLRREVLEHHGEHYDIPLRDGTGLGKPLKLMARPLRPDIPIYLASLGPKAVELAFEIADGWLPIFWSPEKAREVFPLERARDGFEIAAGVQVVVCDDPADGIEALKPYYAFYVGGMGARGRGRNFYNDLVARFGYEEEALRVQELFLDGKQREATAALPDAFVDEVALVGPRERIRERLDAWRESGVTTLLVHSRDMASVRALAELVL